MRSGILYVDKPRGVTSHDVVAAVRRFTGIRTVGHTGTLDPEASGLLILCLGRATKLARFFEDLDKTYWTVLCVGICTNTQDATGVAVRQCAVPALSDRDVQTVLTQFTGPMKQIPPMYSAVKYHGQRLYRLARQGKTVTRPARDIYVRRLKLLDLHGPWISLSVTCSKGTYIRTLCTDIGQVLGVGGHLYALERRRAGPLSIGQALTIDQIAALAAVGTLRQHLIPMDQVLEHLPALLVSGEQARRALHGGAVVPVGMEQLASVSAPVSVRLKDEAGRLLAVGTYDAGMARTIKVGKVLAEIESHD